MSLPPSRSDSSPAGDERSAVPAAFSLLHRTIQEQLYQMRWTNLRSIQVEAIRSILTSDEDLIITAATAGGKTEAAFLPILSSIYPSKSEGIRAVYVGPLKALINDQFRRLEDLCSRAEIEVHRWHGDVSVSAKRNLLKNPGGVLLITPESIESLFINKAAYLPSLFHGLRFIVVDEMHSFIGTERGAHLRSLMSRLSALCSTPPRLVGLSATIGDPAAAACWLSPDLPERVRVIKNSDLKRIEYLVNGYIRSRTTSRDSAAELTEEPATEDDLRMARDIVHTFIGKTALIFANSRARLEFYSDLANRTVEKEGLPNTFRVHHGSLSKAEREETESALRADRPTAAFCSSTLELGIDVGNVKAVGHIGVPWSVSSLTQRLGRSGRHPGEAATMILFVEEQEPGPNSSPVQRLNVELLRSVALTELMLQKWCEPPEVHRLHMSTLVQQTMSVVAERGGATASNLYKVLIERGAFRNVTAEQFKQMLRDMAHADLLEQTPEGDLILGLEGERIVRSADFYSAFATKEEMKVLHGSHLIGTVSAVPGMCGDGFLILAGRRWKVVDVDQRRLEILVEPSKGGRLPFFFGAAGADIHPKVRAQMVDTLRSDAMPAYLDVRAQDMLNRARGYARESGILANPLLADGASTYWFTWTGSKINRTLIGLCKGMEALRAQDEEIAIHFEGIQPDEVADRFRKLLERPPSVVEVAARFEVRMVEKYEAYLSDDLQASVFAQNSLDLAGALALARGGAFLTAGG
jgi:ATP-dependent Lhr-like helicase